MNHFTTPDFWQLYNTLPQEVRALADKNYELLKSNPAHPSLRFKNIEGLWSVRVGRHYRALGRMRQKVCIGFGLGLMATTTSSCREQQETRMPVYRHLRCAQRCAAPDALCAAACGRAGALVIRYNGFMTVQELEKAMTQIPSPELAQFTAWSEEHQADLWDKQIEEDALAGRLNALAEQTNREFEAGHCQAL